MDLSLVPLDEIKEELDKRLDSYVFAYVHSVDKFKEKTQTIYHGGKFVCLGLAVSAQDVILDELKRERLDDN